MHLKSNTHISYDFKDPWGTCKGIDLYLEWHFLSFSFKAYPSKGSVSGLISDKCQSQPHRVSLICAFPQALSSAMMLIFCGLVASMK